MKGASKSKLFLMEFIFVVLMFAICASICVSLFAKSAQFSRLASAMNEGTLVASAAVEQVKAIDTDDEKQLKVEIKKIEDSLNNKYDNKYELKIDYKISDGVVVGKCKVKSVLLGDVCELSLAKYTMKV